MIVGGGATGVEIAAEIKSEYPDQSKEVTIVNSNNNLVAPFSDQSQQALQTQLKDKFGIKLVLSKYVFLFGGNYRGVIGGVKGGFVQGGFVKIFMGWLFKTLLILAILVYFSKLGLSISNFL